MMVSRDEEEQVCEAESEDFTSNGVEQPLPHKDVVFSNAEEEIPEYRKQLLLAKDEMANVADMYQQDYLDKVEQRLMLKFLIPCNRVNDLTSIFIPPVKSQVMYTYCYISYIMSFSTLFSMCNYFIDIGTCYGNC